jgi:hypothetical protein
MTPKFQKKLPLVFATSPQKKKTCKTRKKPSCKPEKLSINTQKPVKKTLKKV